MAPVIQPKETVLFTGDSITDCGRRGEHRPLGAGYVRMAVDLIHARYPAHGCTFVNTGIGGNIVRDLFDRWTDDVIRFQPDWLSVMIGINDLHRHLGDNPDSYDVERYEELYEAILRRTRKKTDAEIILMTPFYMSTAEPSEDGGWRERVMAVIPAYVEAVERLAESYEARLVRTHAMFGEQLKYHRSDAFGGEPVHPNASGHLLIAHEWLKAVDW